MPPPPGAPLAYGGESDVGLGSRRYKLVAASIPNYPAVLVVDRCSDAGDTMVIEMKEEGRWWAVTYNPAAGRGGPKILDFGVADVGGFQH